VAREAKKAGGFRWRLWLGLTAAGLACASAAMAAFETRAYALTDRRFALSPGDPDALTIQGLRYAPLSSVRKVFAEDFGRSVFAIPLAERRRRLLAIDWVEDASVLRIWPDRLLVRIRERTPVAFVSLRSGAMLVDAQGVLLDPAGPKGAPAHFAFPVLDGLRENATEAQRREAVRAFLRFERDMGYLANDVSEVDVADPHNIRVMAQVDNRVVELILGDADFAAHYQSFVSHYAEIRDQSPDAGTFDLRVDGRIAARK
jgi:cell division protein FtsQ